MIFLPLLLVGVTMPPPAAASPPIEYVIVDGRAVERDAYDGTFSEQIEVRGEGERSDRWITGVTTPSVTLYLPEGQPTAAAVICPGGGYGGLSFDKEGTFVAKWLNERGMAAGVLKYSVHTGGALRDKPLQDAQAAIRYLKQKLPGVRVGIVGFSAGGHLAASATNLTSNESGDSSVAFHALIYPVISMEEGTTHGGSRKNLLGGSPSDEQVDRMSMEKRVTAQTPPVFLVHTGDDGAVPVANSLRYVEACVAHGVPAELHVYPEGGHGYGMWQDEGTVSHWPGALEAWLRSLALTAEQ